jgi:hypothetical protein
MIGFARRARAGGSPDAGATARVVARVVPARDVLSAEQDGLTVLLDMKREVYLGLDEVGTVIWREIERGGDIAGITARLHAEFDAPPDVLRADAERFLGELEERGLVVRP